MLRIANRRCRPSGLRCLLSATPAIRIGFSATAPNGPEGCPTPSKQTVPICGSDDPKP